jgi:hypothetical protein
MNLLIDDGKVGALILVGVLTVIVAALTAGVLTIGAAAALVVEIGVWVALIFGKASDMKAVFVDGPIYTGAVRLTAEQVLTPRLILWDGQSAQRAKAIADLSLPEPNLYYNPDGKAYNVVNQIGQDNSNNYIYNYPMYFDSFFKDNMFDNYHDEIDNPMKSKEADQEAKWYVDLCSDMLNLLGVFENQYAAIGKLVLLEKRDGYNVYARLGNINVDYDENKIYLKGTVLTRKS